MKYSSRFFSKSFHFVKEYWPVAGWLGINYLNYKIYRFHILTEAKRIQEIEDPIKREKEQANLRFRIRGGPPD